MLNTILLVVSIMFIVVSVACSIWNLVMVLPFEIPVLSPICIYINGVIRTRYYKRIEYKEYLANYDPDDDDW